MAWTESVNKSYANRAAMVTDIWTQIVAAGWTLHDNVDASSYRVYKSNGENADRLYEYIKIDWITANQIKSSSFGGWNATTHTGYAQASSTPYITTSESGFNGWIYGNANLMLLATKVTTTYYNVIFGHIPYRFDSTPLANVTGDTGTGTQTINVDNTTGFIVNNFYQIIGTDAATNIIFYRYRVQCTAIGTNTLTVTSITTSLKGNYTKIGLCPSTFMASQSGSGGNTCSASTTGSGTSSGSFTIYDFVSALTISPDYRHFSYYGLTPWEASETTASYYGAMGYCTDLFLACSSTVANEDIIGVTQNDTGTATAGGNNTLTDSTKTWSTNAWAGKAVVISTGTGAGQKANKVASNNGTVLTMTASWTINPSVDSVYYIVDEAYRAIGTLDASSNKCMCREGYV